MVVALIPLFEAALQIELEGHVDIPIHWRLFLAAAIGAVLGVLAQVLKRMMGIESEDKDKQIEALKIEIEKKELEHELIEKEIMINSMLLVKDWNLKNEEIKTMKDLEKALKPQEENDFEGDATGEQIIKSGEEVDLSDLELTEEEMEEIRKA